MTPTGGPRGGWRFAGRLAPALVALGILLPVAAGAAGLEIPGPDGETEVVLHLRQAVELALPGLDRTGPAISGWRVKEEKGRLWPELSFNGRYSYESSQVVEQSNQTILGVGQAINRYGADLTLSYNLFQFLESGPKIKGVLAEEQASIFRLTQLQSDRMLRVVEAYLTLLAEREGLIALERLRREHAAHLAEQEARFAHEEIPMVEVVRARGLLASTEREELAIRRRAASAELDLRKLTGLRPEQRITPVFQPEEIDLSLIESLGIPGLLDLARNGNSRLLAANRAVEAARWDSKAARSRLYPRLNVTGNYGYGHDEFTGEGFNFAFSDFRYSVFVLLSWPIFDGGVRKAQVAQSELQAESRLHEARLAAEEIKAQIEDAYWSFQERERTRTLLEQEVDLAEDELNQVSARSAAGVAPPTERLGVLAKLARLQRDLERARADALSKGVELILAVGRNPLLPPSAWRTPERSTRPDRSASPDTSWDRARLSPALQVKLGPAAAEAAPADAAPPAAPLPPAAPIPRRPESPEPRSAAGGPPAGTAPARRLTAIEVLDGDGQTVILIRTDGPVARYSSVRLQGPARLAIDLHGVTEADPQVKRQLETHTRRVERVRIGWHPDRTRIVLDLARLPSGLPRIVERHDGLRVILSDGT